MTQTLWIWSAKNLRITNGKYSITGEVLYRYSWDYIREVFYDVYGVILCREKPEVGTHRDLAIWLTPWKPLTPNQVREMLDGKR